LVKIRLQKPADKKKLNHQCYPSRGLVPSWTFGRSAVEHE
jgi:hypothetical protein